MVHDCLFIYIAAGHHIWRSFLYPPPGDAAGSLQQGPNYTFLNVCEKFTSFCQVLKKMHIKENWFLFFCLTVYKQHWHQFLFVVKATALKQQISKFYPQFRSTEASYHIYVSQCLL